VFVITPANESECAFAAFAVTVIRHPRKYAIPGGVLCLPAAPQGIGVYFILKKNHREGAQRRRNLTTEGAEEHGEERIGNNHRPPNNKICYLILKTCDYLSARQL
jgi:hypothetical protein